MMSISGLGKLLSARSDEELRQMIADLNARHAANRRYGITLGAAIALVLVFLVTTFVR